MPLPPPPQPSTNANDLHFSLLRISLIHLLTSTTTLTTARPSVLDTLTDLAARHLTLLSKLAVSSAEAANRSEVDIRDIRAALEGAGVLRPVGVYDRDGEDVRGVQAFVDWCVEKGKKRIDGGEAQWLVDVMERGVGEGVGRWKGTVLGIDEGGVVTIPVEGALEKRREDPPVSMAETPNGANEPKTEP